MIVISKISANLDRYKLLISVNNRLGRDLYYYEDLFNLFWLRSERNQNLIVCFFDGLNSVLVLLMTKDKRPLSYDILTKEEIEDKGV